MSPSYGNHKSTPKGQGRSATSKLPAQITTAAGVPVIIEPKCKVCQSPHRHAIDNMIIGGYTYSEIERQFAAFGIPRRSISNHHNAHLSYEDAAIRAVIEREAMMAQKNFDEGVERLVTKQTYLEVAMQKAYDQLINGMVEIPAGDAVKIIDQLQRLEAQHHDVAIDELRVQFNAFMQAVKETVPTDLWEKVRDRTHEILKQMNRSGMVVTPTPEDVTDPEPLAIAEAEVVPDEAIVADP